jgi:hypothetical protein
LGSLDLDDADRLLHHLAGGIPGVGFAEFAQPCGPVDSVRESVLPDPPVSGQRDRVPGQVSKVGDGLSGLRKVPVDDSYEGFTAPDSVEGKSP